MDITPETIASVIAAIHAAAIRPERWPEAVTAVTGLVNGEPERRHARDWEGIPEAAAPDDPPIGDDAHDAPTRRLLALLALHLRTARHIQSKLAETLHGRLALASLDRMDVAAVVASRTAGVVHLNASARALLGSGACIRIRNSRVEFHDRALNQCFETALCRATEDRPAASVLPIAFHRKKAYEASVAPLQVDGVSSESPAALLTVVCLLPDSDRVIQRARRLHGLTEAEARVMCGLALGKSVDELARAHGVRTSTVRAQVRSIFEKTGVHRQSQLVRLALTGSPSAAPGG